jgi:hypothetical protein
VVRLLACNHYADKGAKPPHAARPRCAQAHQPLNAAHSFLHPAFNPMTDSPDKNEPLFAFLGFLDSEPSAEEKTTIDTEQGKEAREAQKIWLAAMQDASVVYAKRRGESFRRDMQEFVNTYRSGHIDQLPALSPMAVLQSEIIGTVAVMLQDYELMIKNAGVQGDTGAVIKLSRTYVQLHRASAAFAQVAIA